MINQPTDIELQARNLISGARDTDWSPTQQAVLNAFQAQWYASLPAPRVQRIAEALADLPDGSLVVQPVLTRLVRRRVLRSRTISGRTHYELAL